MRCQMEELTDVVDKRRKLLRAESLAFMDNQKLASSRDFIAQLKTGRYICAIWTSHLVHFKHKSQRSSPWLMCNGGVEYNDRFSSQVCQHETSDMHQLSIELEAERAKDPLVFSLQMQLSDAREITLKLFRTVYDNAKHFRSFLDFENLVCTHVFPHAHACMHDNMHVHMYTHVGMIRD